MRWNEIKKINGWIHVLVERLDEFISPIDFYVCILSVFFVKKKGNQGERRQMKWNVSIYKITRQRYKCVDFYYMS